MQTVMGTHSGTHSHSGLYEGFNDKIPTTLDPCDDIEAAGDVQAAADDVDDVNDVDENGPPIVDPCPECGRALTRLADWIPAPATQEAAWEGWVRSCVATQSSLWQWCPQTGWLTARLRVNWPRRVTLPPPPAARVSDIDLALQTADTFVGYH